MKSCSCVFLSPRQLCSGFRHRNDTSYSILQPFHLERRSEKQSFHLEIAQTSHLCVSLGELNLKRVFNNTEWKGKTELKDFVLEPAAFLNI